MSYNSCEIEARSDTVFAVIADPHTYPAWLVGNAEVREVEPDWPRPGSKFHHRVGIGPFTLADSSEVVEIEPGRLLRLHVRARPFISAMSTFRVVGDGVRTVVSLEEEPVLRLVGAIVRPLMDPLTHVRNHASLRQLASYIEARDRDGPTSTS